MIKGKISSIESLGTLDGAGVRYVVFMQGCTLRCLYCHNPETWAMNEGVITLTPNQLVKRIESCRPYFGDDGGVTFSGGEPLLQPKFLIETLALCKEKGIHTALDTAGVGLGDYDEILSFVDLVILDVKAVDEAEYQKITGRDMCEFNRFLSACQRHGNKLWIRQVILPNFNDDQEHISSFARFLKGVKNIEKIELLPYKKIGVHKYDTLKLNYRLKDLPEMDETKCQAIENQLKLLMGE